MKCARGLRVQSSIMARARVLYEDFANKTLAACVEPRNIIKTMLLRASADPWAAARVHTGAMGSLARASIYKR